ncbi:DUF2442 domain-containing protein [Ruminococcus difficilis]|uniref:DUF2442 domain-containing protein n=1 Tax=Ruminococcus difficilis TaxID=2763069 RepID=A0A934WPG1_9FIRM|nr:DUF2442 domain-containing protein [Ruminococcus difficilis]MBK6087951.1 DUF2442 domain-containing protein [Ruminococcus difficilis]
MPNTVDFYLSKGFDRPMAEYFARGRKRLAAVAPQHDFTLLLTYEDGEQRVYDMKPLLEKGGVFEPFREYAAFQRVYLDDTCSVAWDIDPDIDSSVVWNNKVDICPDGCYVDSVPLSEYKAVS